MLIDLKLRPQETFYMSRRVLLNLKYLSHCIGKEVKMKQNEIWDYMEKVVEEYLNNNKCSLLIIINLTAKYYLQILIKNTN